MTARTCRGCGSEFSGGEQFCPNDGSRLSSASQARTEALSQESDTKSGKTVKPREAAGAAPVDPLVGSTLDARYKVLGIIGEGGMGVVYEAQHVLIEKQVAIKVLREAFTGRPDVVERFRQEAKSASKIGHPNIVDVIDFGETPAGQSYIVMEMLTGEDLADVLARERTLTPSRAVRIAYQVARALHATHKKNIVHRDLKPENIYLIERDGVADIVKVVDFGVAKMNDVELTSGRKLTRTGMIFGTPEYMSPEQALGRPFDHRVDIYALGAILFELLSGRVPFEGENFMEILAKHGRAAVPALHEVNSETHVSASLEAVVMRALVKDPERRYASMGELADALRSTPEMPSLESSDDIATWAVAEPPASQPPPLPRRTPPSVRVRAEVTTGDANARDDTLPRTRTPRSRMPPEPPLDAVLISEGSRRPRAWLWLAAVVTTAAVAVPLAGYAWQHGALSLDSPAQNADPAHGVAATATTINAASAIIPPALSEPVSLARTEPNGPVPDAPSLVEVQVRTQPAGASVRALGFGLGSEAQCSSAPCALAVPRGRPVTLRAETPSASVERTLTFDERADVELHVSKPAGSTAKPGNKPATTARRVPSDLKVPSMFRDP